MITLQKILGYHDIKVTMRYALTPDHLEMAGILNPLATH